MLSCRFSSVLLLLALAAAVGISLPAAATDGSDVPATVFEAAPGCPATPSETARPSGTGQPPSVDYPVCADHRQRLTAALVRASQHKRLVIVEFGATWCSSCKSLRRQLDAAGILGRQVGELSLADTFDVISIPVSMLHAGRRLAVPSGEAVLRDLLARAPAVSLRAVPFLVVIDPSRPDRVWARNIDDVESTSAGRHDPAKVAALLAEAHSYLRASGPRPSEPGWLMRKVRRWLN
jgi:thiol-disulfide isomerase/thioredoxin